MLDEKQKLLKKNRLFSLRKNAKETSAWEKGKSLCFVVAMIICFSIVIAIYFLSDLSNVYRVVADGNVYLKDSDIIALSEVTTDSKFVLTVPALVEKKVRSSPLIDECHVELLEGRLIKINVKEKKIIAYTMENGLSVLIGEDDSRIPIGKENFYLISKVPLLEGFNEDEIRLIEKNLQKCDYTVIDEISEIHSFPELKYQNVEVIMRDGNYIFTSVYGLEILNKYFDIESSYLSGKNKCYYFEDISGNAYTTACPWEAKEEENDGDRKEDEPSGQVEEDDEEEE